MSYSLVARRLRLPLGFLLGGLYLAFARPTPLSLTVGAAIGFVGILVRAWASGHIAKNERLAVGGPYGHTRNPLYFGSFLIAAGFAMAADLSLLLLVIAFWALVYGPTIVRERRGMRTRFPEGYAEYEQNVPLFVPRPTRWRAPGAEETRFSFDLYMQHGEWKALLVYVLAVAWLALRTRWHL